MILPALATSWTPTENPDGTVDITFQLRQGVVFHDGQPWNAAACKLNFDNVFAPALVKTYHSWFDLPTKTTSWRVAGPFTFVMTLDGPYYPVENELSFIRPLRFLSPAAFVPGAANNSCPVAIKNGPNITAGNSWVWCSGTLAPYGTGPWMFEVRVGPCHRPQAALYPTPSPPNAVQSHQPAHHWAQHCLLYGPQHG